MEISNLNTVPHNPGVYLWKNNDGKIIYVGKANNLKNRMKQYFKGSVSSYKTSKLVQQIHSFEYIITKSSKDALILERNLIKEHTPKFNILLMDDKRYPYIKIKLLKKDLQIINTRRVMKDGAIYFGPFPSGFGARNIMNLIIRLAKYENGLPINNKSQTFWLEKFKFVKNILSHDNSNFKKTLEKQMLHAAQHQQYELANDVKTSLQSLNFYSENQLVEFKEQFDFDVFGIIKQGDYLSISIMFYRQGKLLSKIDKVIEIQTKIEDDLRQYLLQYYEYNYKPSKIIIDSEYFVENLYEIEIFNPKKGTYKKALEIANKNADDNLETKLNSFIRKTEITHTAIKTLGNVLGISTPYHIRMLDNSTTNNTDPVGVIITYKNGIKQKHLYKKYNLVINGRLADVEYVKQVSERFLSSDNLVIPDLFILDGGKPQVNEFKKVMQRLNIKMNVIGLVKNDKHVTESIIDLSGTKINIENKNLLLFLREMQSEVDRFAKVNHRSRRMKTSFDGILTSINGVGHKIEQKLLDAFGSYSAIYNSDIKDLSQVVSPRIAKLIKEKLSKK